MKQTFQICYTSDTHGHVFPVNYAAHSPEASGLLNLACQVGKDGDTLLLDGGDSLQGTPLSQYYLDHSAACAVHPIAAAFNALGLDYFTLGNHDFNFGYEALKSYLCAMNAVCLCANLQDLKGELPLRAEAVHTLASGLRVGITGVVTDHVNVWEQPQNLEHLRVTDTFQAAKAALARLRPLCEVCVCIYHGGFEKDLATGRTLSSSGENIACKMARELNFDLLLTGHQHMAVEGVRLGGTYAAQPPAGAGQYLRVKGVYSGGACRFSSALLPVGRRHPAQPYQDLLGLEEKVQAWLDQPIGTLHAPIPPEEKLSSALYGSQVAALFNQVQLAATGADFSCTSLGNAPVGLASPVTMRGVTSAYLFSNTLVVLQVTEPVLRAALERCAAYFTLKNGRPAVSEAFLLPKIEHYNYDFFAGLAYTFDLRRPVGSRVTRLARLGGAPLGPGPFSLCTSNYRATGTGGYEALRDCPVLWRGSTEMPELVARYIQAHSPLPPLHNADLEVVWQA
ncbi:bifunctional metallophosphatase/5'-nucleotidase [Allofournierella sp.]|uniref:bifunctional metallophosphatase/5'-nucleotidase n=1 Tax=Allofournierella sp. TaxID=1940256 RepID=UPI003AB321D7